MKLGCSSKRRGISSWSVISRKTFFSRFEFRNLWSEEGFPSDPESCNPFLPSFFSTLAWRELRLAPRGLGYFFFFLFLNYLGHVMSSFSFLPWWIQFPSFWNKWTAGTYDWIKLLKRFLELVFDEKWVFLSKKKIYV